MEIRLENLYADNGINEAERVKDVAKDPNMNFNIF